MYCFCSSRRRHTRCALVTGVQTCALPIYVEFIDGARAAPPCLSARGDTVYQRRTARERALVSEKCRVSAICATLRQIGRASCRERVCQYVWISVVAVPLKTHSITIDI